MQQQFFINSSPDTWFDAILSLSYTGSIISIFIFFTSGLGLCFNMHFSAVRPFVKTCAFPDHFHSIEFATGELHSKCGNIYKQYECS